MLMPAMLLLGGGGGFSPADIADLRAWYRETFTASGGDVSEWTDKSGTGRHLTQSTAARKPYGDDVSLEVNAQAALRFLREDNQYVDGATASDWTFLHDMAGGCTVALWLIADRQDAGEGAILDTSSGTSAAGGFGLWFLGNTSTAWFLVMNGTTTIINASFTVSNSVPALLVFRCDTAGNYTVRVDGVEVASGVRSTSPNTSAPSRPLRVGNFQDAIAYSVPSTFVCPELVMYARDLTLAETQQLEAYMTARYSMAAYTEGSTTTPLASPLTGTVEVLFVGDSITLGTGASGALLGGFRNRISTLCSGYANFTLSAVGPANTGAFGGMGDAHDGQSGWTIRGNAHSYVASGHSPDSIPGNAGEIDTVIPSPYAPDIVVLMLGTNNVSTDPENVWCDSNGYQWETLVRAMIALLPTARFVLCAVTPTNLAARYWAREDLFNQAMRLAVRRIGGNVVFCDTNSVVNPATGISGDNVHPNDTGYTAIGDEIWPAIRRAGGYS